MPILTVKSVRRKSGIRCRWCSVWPFLKAWPNDGYPYHRRIRCPSRDMECIWSPISGTKLRYFDEVYTIWICYPQVQFLFFCLDFLFIVVRLRWRRRYYQLHLFLFLFFPSVVTKTNFRLKKKICLRVVQEKKHKTKWWSFAIPSED